MTPTWDEGEKAARGSVLAENLLNRIRSGEIDPRKAADALGLGFDQDDITAILLAALAPGWRSSSVADGAGALASERSPGETPRKSEEGWGEGPFYFSDAVHFIELILPLAKGYAAAHLVGSNDEYVREAEGYALEARHFIGECGDFFSSGEVDEPPTPAATDDGVSG